MATRARIGIKSSTGEITAAYQHWDGYPGGLGYNLCEHWTNPDKVLKAIQLGSASKWGQIIGDKIDFDDRSDEMYDVQNVYYGRDRGERDQGPRTFKNEAEYLAEGFGSGEEYIYLMKQEGEQDYLGQPLGTWYYAASTYTKDDKITPTQFKHLEEDAILDHIDSLKRHLQSIKQRGAA
jgi:hypothetical protein